MLCIQEDHYGNLKARHCSHCFQYYFSQLLAGFFFALFRPLPVGECWGEGKTCAMVKPSNLPKGLSYDLTLRIYWIW
ncbi:hypothetical protein BXL21_28200 [Salmonella enterica subsp. enterica serovar Enteritidis]|nr:hypothetical protein [Salmonella enterica subsp. enterica serovar Enteritidis]